ncbi:MAG: hypothetical protein ACW977_13325 [Candidatus Thorarchaeota archaeon]
MAKKKAKAPKYTFFVKKAVQDFARDCSLCRIETSSWTLQRK